MDERKDNACMSIDLKIRHSTAKYSWLCFRHATQEAMRGETVETELVESSHESYIGHTVCDLCSMEWTEKEKHLREWFEKYRKNK